MTATAKTYDRQTAKFIAVVAENMPELSGDVMQGWIQNPKAVQKLLAGFAPSETTVAAPREFATWKTVKIGTHKNVKDLSKALTSNNFRIGDWAADILKRTPLAETETEIELVLVSVADLGFKKATRRDAIYDRAKELGLGLVPAEVGPQLRLDYSDQPMDEWLLMGMEPIAGSDGYPLVFHVVCDADGQWLGAYYGRPGFEWLPAYRWVFARRKQN